MLLDLKRRGRSIAPKIVVADGVLGFWKAIGELWPKTCEQRCWVQRTNATHSPAADALRAASVEVVIGENGRR
jgi:transposase-like protein